MELTKILGLRSLVKLAPEMEDNINLTRQHDTNGLTHFFELQKNCKSIGFFFKMKGFFYSFLRQLKGFKGVHAKYRFLKVLMVPLWGLKVSLVLLLVNKLTKIILHRKASTN